MQPFFVMRNEIETAFWYVNTGGTRQILKNGSDYLPYRADAELRFVFGTDLYAIKSPYTIFSLYSMKRNMCDWKDSILSSAAKKAMPIMTYPGLALTGNSVIEMVTKGEIQFNCIKALADRYSTVACATVIMDLSVEAEVFGSKIHYSDHEIPAVSERLIHNFNQLGTFTIPPVGLHRTKEYLKAAQRAAATISDRPTLGGIIGPFSLAGRLYDITEMMIAILMDPTGAHELLDLCTTYLKNYAAAFKEAGSNGVVIAEPAAGLLSPDLCDEFSSRYVKHIVDHVQDETFIVMLHNCGNTNVLVPSMSSTGCKALHFGNAVDMLEILPQVDTEILVFGNIDPVRVIKNASPETVYSAAFDLLVKTKHFPNFVISSGCDIPPNTPLANLDAFFKAIEQFNISSSAM
jgi:uroporphyrinogen decarboxylase